MAAAGQTLAELAARCGGEVRGDGSVRLTGVATIQNAAPGSIAFLANPHYKRFLAETRAGALILSAEDAKDTTLPALITSNPYLVYPIRGWRPVPWWKRVRRSARAPSSVPTA
jgi:UDP-3-O-[3-hydroxymyristoyl] glucosamine N-acyltransferase